MKITRLWHWIAAKVLYARLRRCYRRQVRLRVALTIEVARDASLEKNAVRHWVVSLPARQVRA